MQRSATVIGGGPAGASAALGLLGQGFTVTLLERRRGWRGRVCGAFINSEAAQHLKVLGLYDGMLRAGAVQVTQATVTTRRAKASVATQQHGLRGLAIPRKNLEENLLDAARRAGAEIRMGTRVTRWRETNKTYRVEFLAADGRPQALSAPLLVLAGGRCSMGTDEIPRASSGWFGFNALFRGVRQNPGEMSLHFYPGGYIGVMTFKDATSNICGLAFRDQGGAGSWPRFFEHARKHQPELKRLTASAERTADWQGVGPLPFTASMRRSDGPLLVGDAAGVGDPFMGEGIGRALGAGPMISACIQSLGDRLSSQLLLRRYEQAWRRRYNTRMRIGFCSRPLLAGTPLLGRVMDLALSQNWLLLALTRRFHAAAT